ncbi:MAG TPA: hypothetical protein VKB00_08645 [Candidatus Limnocylindrales bacterium]|nr:hypothetical protein [Candidatus Limnocylindrales bacterium]
MTDLDRLQRRLPDLMAELSPPRVPDYFDDMLQASARTRQRPAWASLERWLPVEITARPAPFGLPSWRPVLTSVVIVALLATAAALMLAGSKSKLPPLFGPARNGAIVYDSGGDILALDPATGRTSTVIGGTPNDWGPYLSPDGRSMLFLRRSAGVDTLYTATIDGTDVKEFAAATDASWNEWSPDSKRIVFVGDGGGTPSIRDVASGATRSVPVSSSVNTAQWLTDGQLLVAADSESGSTFWTINADGTEQRPLTTPKACCDRSVLAGSGLLAWTSWDLSANTLGRIHVMDVGSGADTLLHSTQKPGLHFLDPRFSPDGRWLLVKEFVALSDGVRLGLIAADGAGEFIPIGRKLPKNDSEIHATFSPDGTEVLVTYDDGSAWLYAIPGGGGSQVDWAGLVETSWQRLAIE